MRPKLDLYSQEGTCIKVYNPIEKKLIGVYPSFRKASDKMGISEKTLKLKVSSKNRVYSEYYKMEVAIRHCTIKEEDNLLIQKTLKNQQL